MGLSRYERPTFGLFGPIQGAFWDYQGSWRPNLGPFGPILVVLRPIWAYPGGSESHFGPILKAMKPIWTYPGDLLCRSRRVGSLFAPIQGGNWAYAGGQRANLRLLSRGLLAYPGGQRANLGPIWPIQHVVVLFGLIQGAFWAVGLAAHLVYPGDPLGHSRRLF